MRGGSARSLFREQAGQEVRRRASACFVAREIAADQIAGFYTLALLWDAIERAGRSEVAVYAFVVDAKMNRLRPSIYTMVLLRSAARRDLSSYPCRRNRDRRPAFQRFFLPGDATRSRREAGGSLFQLQ